MEPALALLDERTAGIEPLSMVPVDGEVDVCCVVLLGWVGHL